jgi:hypothetical protein
VHHDIPPQTGLFATNALGSFWWVCDLLYRNGPSWSLLPPSLIGVASVVGAVRGFLNDRQARRHKEEEHRARMAATRPMPQ